MRLFILATTTVLLSSSLFAFEKNITVRLPNPLFSNSKYGKIIEEIQNKVLRANTQAPRFNGTIFDSNGFYVTAGKYFSRRSVNTMTEEEMAKGDTRASIVETIVWNVLKKIGYTPLNIRIYRGSANNSVTLDGPNNTKNIYEYLTWKTDVYVRSDENDAEARKLGVSINLVCGNYKEEYEGDDNVQDSFTIGVLEYLYCGTKPIQEDTQTKQSLPPTNDFTFVKVYDKDGNQIVKLNQQGTFQQ